MAYDPIALYEQLKPHVEGHPRALKRLQEFLRRTLNDNDNWPVAAE